MRRHRRNLLGSIVIAGITLAGCGSDDDSGDQGIDEAVTGEAADGAADISEPGLVTAPQAATLAATDSVTVIDVRTPEEYDDGHLADAVLVDLSSGSFATEIAELDRDGEYLVYCRSGNRSAEAVAIMEDLGFEQVWELDGGIVAWSDAGLPLVT